MTVDHDECRHSRRKLSRYQKPDQQPPTGSKLRSLAFALLAKREYSRYDLEQKLLSYEADIDEVTTLVDELVQACYQDDRRMAGMVVRSQIRQGKGPRRVQQALSKHQIDPTLASEDMQTTDWLAHALTLKIKKFGEAVTTDPKEKARQIRFLQYRGFDLDLIMKVVNQSAQELREELE